VSFTKDDIISAIKTVFDPEIPVNVWDLGLIYDIDVSSRGVPARLCRDGRTRDPMDSTVNQNGENLVHGEIKGVPDNFSAQPKNFRDDTLVTIKMTMTSPTCPMAEELLEMVRVAAESVAGVGNVTMELVWDPPWTLDRMSPVARLELDLTEEGW